MRDPHEQACSGHTGYHLTHLSAASFHTSVTANIRSGGVAGAHSTTPDLCAARAPCWGNWAAERSTAAAAEADPCPTKPSRSHRPSARALPSQHSHPPHCVGVLKTSRFLPRICLITFLNASTFLAPALSEATSISYPKARDQMQIEANSRESYIPFHATNPYSLFIACRYNTESKQIQKTTLSLRAAPCQ